MQFLQKYGLKVLKKFKIRHKQAFKIKYYFKAHKGKFVKLSRQMLKKII